MIIKLDKNGGEGMSINTSLNYLVEALTYFSRKVNGQNARVVLDSLSGKFENYRDELEELIRPVIELEAFLDSQIQAPDERLKFFFKNFTRLSDDMASENSNPAGLIFCMPEYNGFEELSAFRDSLKSMTPGQVRYQICGALQVSGLNPETNEMTIGELSKHIDALAIPLECKWDIIDTYKHFSAYTDELYEIVQPAIRLIAEREELYTKLLDDFTELYSSIPNLEKFLSEKFGMDVTQNLPLEFHPSILGFNSLYITRAASANVSKLFIGVLVKRFVEITSHDETITTLSNITKALSDPGRLEILCYLREHTAYGQELSDRFKLSTTTIWHHMNKLQVSGFVSSIFGGNRTYYAMDKDKVRNYIARLKWLLLNEK
ncbi:MAG: ArsR/SmtB family transcription factor [Candidatus Gastranaerophilaceae bacterium]|jgi:DNA-binding transcriptional ArsR family regulator|nr:winged helix-turn-helix domain-containing protein [Christensenellales bacterium]